MHDYVMSTMWKWEMLAFGPGAHKGMTRPNPARMEVAPQLLHFLLIFCSNGLVFKAMYGLNVVIYNLLVAYLQWQS